MTPPSGLGATLAHGRRSELAQRGRAGRRRQLEGHGRVQRRHRLGGVGDDHEALGGRGDDLLARVRAAAALDRATRLARSDRRRRSRGPAGPECVEVFDGDPEGARGVAVRGDVATNTGLGARRASASSRYATVDPVPSPTRMPSRSISRRRFGGESLLCVDAHAHSADRSAMITSDARRRRAPRGSTSSPARSRASASRLSSPRDEPQELVGARERGIGRASSAGRPGTRR